MSNSEALLSTPRVGAQVVGGRQPSRMDFGLVDHPNAVPREAYDDAVARMVRVVRELPGVLALYQVGGVSTPGISDVDMVAVFDDGVTCDVNPVLQLDAVDRYLFIHNLYGVPRQHFAQARRLSFFHNYRLLQGDAPSDEGTSLTDAEVVLLKRQIALEYLVKLFATLTLQRTYRTVKVRGFLLHVRAVAYDLEFLGVDEGDLYDLTELVVAWRTAWFERTPAPEAFLRVFDAFYGALVALLGGLGNTLPFYLPGSTPHRIARSLSLRSGQRLGARRVGLVPPTALRLLGNRYFKLANRLNRFEFTVPVSVEPLPSILAERVQLVDAMRSYNRSHLPGFDILTTSL